MPKKCWRSDWLPIFKNLLTLCQRQNPNYETILLVKVQGRGEASSKKQHMDFRFSVNEMSFLIPFSMNTLCFLLALSKLGCSGPHGGFAVASCWSHSWEPEWQLFSKLTAFPGFPLDPPSNPLLLSMLGSPLQWIPPSKLLHFCSFCSLFPKSLKSLKSQFRGS